MKLKFVLDEFNDLELKEYLLGQDGINSVDINIKDFVMELLVDFDNKVTPFIVYKYIKLFDRRDVSSLMFFDKNVEYEIKTLKYVVKDICCEYCYKSLIEKLFLNDNIKSVKSNFDFNNFRNIELIIEYSKDYNEEELIEYIKRSLP